MSRSRSHALTAEEKARAHGVEVLASEGETAIGELIARLDEPSWVVRRAVVSALGRMGGPAVAPLCRVISGDRTHEGRLAAAVEALVASSGDADAEVLTLTESPIGAVVCDAIQILGRRLSSQAVGRLTILAAATDDNVALAAIEALGRIGGEAAVTPLIAAIESRSFSRAFPAIDVLGRSGSRRALRPLLGILEEPLYSLEAARALGRIGDPSAVPPLSALLARPSEAIVRSAALAIAEILQTQRERFGSHAPVEAPLHPEDVRAPILRIVHCLEASTPVERTTLVGVLGWLGGKTAVGTLIGLLSTDEAASRGASDALRRIGTSAEPELLLALERGPSEIRLLVLPLLSHRSEVAEPVARCLADADAEVRALACDVLARVGSTSFTARLFELLADADLHVAQSATAAIQSLAGNDTERLTLDACRSQEARVRRGALRIAGYFAYPSARDALIAAVGNSDEKAREAALMGLAYIDDPRARETLLTATRDPLPKTRASAVRALGYTRGEEATLAALRAGLRDSDGWVRYFACQALSRLNDRDSGDVIAEMIDDAAGQVRVAVVEALAVLRGARAMRTLEDAATTGDPDVQRAAIVGLGLVKDPMALGVLRRARMSPDAATRLVAVSALAEFDLGLVATDLDLALSDEDDDVRAAVVALLAARPGDVAARLLVAHLTDARLQEGIVDALTRPLEGRLEVVTESLPRANAETAPLIVSVLARTPRSEASRVLEDAFRTSDVIVRRAIAPALAAMRTGSSRSLLDRAAAEDPDEEVREIGRAAAGR